jgi:geranyl-CoA carboxylase beta subunit
MIKHGATMIQAETTLRVPRLTLQVGASYGAGNYGMCGWAYEPDFLFLWPNAHSGVMGGAEAARTMALVARAAAERRGTAPDEAALAAQEAAIAARFDAQAGAFHTSGRVLDHGVIDPADSRLVLGFCLDTIAEAKARVLRPLSFGVARM